MSDKTGKVSGKTVEKNCGEKQKTREKIGLKVIEKVAENGTVNEKSAQRGAQKQKKCPITTQKTGKTTQKTTQKTEKTTQKVLDAIRTNPCITRDELANLTGISADGIKWHLKQLKDKNIIRRIGGKKGGHWEIVQGAENE